ncbi:hypothetical protein D6D19_07600 [Aureobasidium pullulans]|uniref:Major facilitator superfamily (MFS) profile domain-containing protein n=1 Tax=Aureobasidium pullulans TaxID=5580 RepID=A0A4S9KL06_AURPU|nr:hypothetical protein D6D19_07600 [Aureobasidium pullulans]THY16821.1 hypothetical protein D6D00_08730 [Aureobasidium pullulans]
MIGRDAQDEPMRKSASFKLTIAFLCLVAALSALDAVIVSACLPAIAQDLHGTSTETFWVGTSFLLGQTITIPFFGVASEVFGRKLPILIAISLFLLGSILSATAQSTSWLIGARTVQGIGAGGTIQLVQLIISDITTMQERGIYIAMSSFGWAFGTIAGVPIGGAIAEHTTWRVAFWINVPFCVICFTGLVCTLKLHHERASFQSKVSRIDWIGLGMFTGATTLFLVGLTSGGTSHPWRSAATLVPLVLGASLYASFVFVEWRVSRFCMMPLQIFRNIPACVGFITSFLQGMILWCSMYYMIIYVGMNLFLGVLQHGLLRSAAETLSYGAFVAPAGVAASIAVKRTMRYKYLIVAGWFLTTLGTGINVITLKAHSSKAQIFAPRCIAAIGAGLLFPTPLFAVQAKQSKANIGVATTMQVFFRSLGMAFGVALGGVIFQNRWDHVVGEAIASGLLPMSYNIPSAHAELAYALISQMPPAVQSFYRDTYAESLIMVWWVMFAFAVLGLSCSLFGDDEKLSPSGTGVQSFAQSDEHRDSLVV